MHPDDIPTAITKLVYAAPHLPGVLNGLVLSQNQAADLLAVFWPEIERHVRGQAVGQIDAEPDPGRLHAAAIRLHDAIANAAATTSNPTTAEHLDDAQIAMAPVLTALRRAAATN